MGQGTPCPVTHPAETATLVQPDGQEKGRTLVSPVLPPPPPRPGETEARTGDGLLGAEAEGVFHEAPLDAAGGRAQRVEGQQGVDAVVDVGGAVELEAAVQDGGVGLELHHPRVDVGPLGQRRAVEEPAHAGHRVAVHREGDAPVVLRDGLVQQQDDWRNWERRSGWAAEADPAAGPLPRAAALRGAHR